MNFANVLALVEDEQFDKAVEQLQKMPVASVPAEQIRPWIFHPDDALRQLAVTLLGQKGDLASIVDLARLFEADLDFYDHDYIFEAYERMGEPAVAGLLELVKHGTPRQASAALQGLGHIGTPAVPSLIELLQEGDVDELLFVALENSHDPRAVPALIAYLVEHLDDDQAAYALESSIDESCHGAVAELARILKKSRRGEVRRALIRSLGKTKAPAAVAPLRNYLKEPDAAEALGGIAHSDAVNVLSGGLKLSLQPSSLDAILCALLCNPLTGEELRRQAAQTCLMRADLPKAVDSIAASPACRPVMERAAQSPEPLCRLLLANALGEKEAASHYEFVTECGDLTLLREMASKGGRLPLAVVESLSRHPDDELRWRLANSMRMRGKSISVLMGLLSDRKAKVRRAAVWALDRQSEAFDQLREMHRDRSRKVRSAASCTIGRLRDLDPEEQILALARFLYDQAGRPVDLEQGVLCPFDGGEERPYMLSEALGEMKHPLASRVLAEWAAAGGKRA